jgi:hypothetical protein
MGSRKAPAGRHYPFTPLAAWCERQGETSLRHMAILLHVSQSAVRHWIKEGVPEATADRVAVQLIGRHPCNVWPEWDDLLPPALDLDDDLADLAPRGKP